MGVEKIKDVLVNAGYIASQLTIGRHTLNIKNVYIKEGKEAYIISDNTTEEEIRKIEKELISFQNWTDNEILKYNINILLPYRITDMDEEELNRLIYKYENDTNICRKIFVNLDDEDFTTLLPFTEVNIKDIDFTDIDLLSEVSKLFSNQDEYKSFTMSDFNCEKFIMDFVVEEEIDNE